MRKDFQAAVCYCMMMIQIFISSGFLKLNGFLNSTSSLYPIRLTPIIFGNMGMLLHPKTTILFGIYYNFLSLAPTCKTPTIAHNIYARVPF